MDVGKLQDDQMPIQKSLYEDAIRDSFQLGAQKVYALRRSRLGQNQIVRAEVISILTALSLDGKYPRFLNLLGRSERMTTL